MRRVAVIVTMLLIISACNSSAEPTTTTSSTSTTTTTTTIPTTTTTLLSVGGDGVDPELTELIRALYTLPAGAAQVAAPPVVIEGFGAAVDVIGPTAATGYVGTMGEVRLAVIEAGEDITLAVADPDWRVVGGWWPSHQVAAELGEFPKTVAVVGSDARPNEDRERTRADSIHFVVLDGSGSAAVVGLPRDSWVPIPGAGSTKVNAALAMGGPEVMMDTFTELTGAEFDGYLLTGFAGFQSMIEVLGGLEIDVPRALNDRSAKASIEAGLQMLSASDALAFTRVRKALPDGDFGRQANGGLALIAGATMVKALGPVAVPALIEQTWDMYSTDMDAENMLTLAVAITQVDPTKASNVVAAGSPGQAGAASVVFLQDGAFDTFEDMLDGQLE